MTLKPEYFGKPEKDHGKYLEAKTFFQRAENSIYCVFSDFSHVLA